MDRKAIRKVALSFIDQEELTGNSGFKDPKFEDMMEIVGWRKGQAWCSYFVELVWQQSGMDTTLCSASAVQTYINHDRQYLCHSIVKVGDIVIWQTYRNGKPRWTGHAGIVVSLVGQQIITVEGNTNENGGREGIEVALKIRRRNNFDTNNGLRLRGFITPIKIPIND